MIWHIEKKELDGSWRRIGEPKNATANCERNERSSLMDKPAPAVPTPRIYTHEEMKGKDFRCEVCDSTCCISAGGGALMNLVCYHCFLIDQAKAPAVPTRAKLPIDRPCSACSAGDTDMKYHDHAPPFRGDAAPAASPWRTGTPDSSREVLTRRRYEGMLIYSLAIFSSSYNKPYTRRWWSDDDEKIAVDEWMDIPTGEAPPVC